jgi:hypothetical protein
VFSCCYEIGIAFYEAAKIMSYNKSKKYADLKGQQRQNIAVLAGLSLLTAKYQTRHTTA